MEPNLRKINEVEVTVSVTLSKVLKVNVEDVYDNIDLKNAVEEQYILPQDECPDWDLDDFEVILE